ncbi:MAG TPA: hypothetical protein PLP75_00360 [Burkholderiales bacterium]|nr:hypothetical protein [Burkholderiales bacterium]
MLVLFLYIGQADLEIYASDLTLDGKQSKSSNLALQKELPSTIN